MAAKDAHVYTDGASQGNPGPAGIGYVIQTAKGEPLLEEGAYIGKATNNVAEYAAALAGVRKCLQLNMTSLVLFSDSELLVRQLKGEYKIKNQALKDYYKALMAELKKFKSAKVEHIPREQNKQADKLAGLGAQRRESLDATIHLRTPAEARIEPCNSLF